MMLGKAMHCLELKEEVLACHMTHPEHQACSNPGPTLDIIHHTVIYRSS